MALLSLYQVGGGEVSAPPRPDWLLDGTIIGDKLLEQARAYIEHLEARIAELNDQLDHAGYDVAEAIDRLAEQAELEREARD